MPSKSEKQRRRKILLELKEKEYQEFIKSIPVKKELIIELFDFLDLKLDSEKCNDDYRITKAYFKTKGIENPEIYEWFRENGGYCDCEILCNIEEKLE